ncbi:MAG: 4-alpha-glucanotransferase [Anaerolineales bacterium]|nr:4-alpha-glucanotransferase [Anaerolineales bacterium]
MELTRASGILLHPTSFPGPHGMGDLGEAAFQFVDFLVAAKQSLWQVLPLGPTGYGDSPYASFSSFAGNPLLINLTKLIEAGDLSAGELAEIPPFPVDTIDFGWVIHWKIPLLERAARNFLAGASAERRADFEAFCAEHAGWLDDFALFMAVKEQYDRQAAAENVFGAMWSNYWAKDIALRRPAALKRWRQEQAEAIAVKKVLQYYFFQQWTAVKEYANGQGIRIIGDIPIFVAPDSVDVWANRELFFLDKEGQPTVVAGVPPDYFSETGQLWGNPLYNWKKMAAQDYQWWIERIQATLRLVDIIRIDHFRGFEAYWEVPFGEDTAINGRWVKAPGMELFETIEKELGTLPILAEDLGVITPEVEALRDHFKFPGMKILQFAFDSKEAGGLDATNKFLPHNHGRNAVVYTGTHDNDTTKGWYRERTPEEKDLVRRYLARPDDDIVWDFIRLAIASVARLAIIPFQDALNLDSDARMNTPSVLGGNWAWRYRSEALNPWVANRLSELVDLYGRDPALWQKKAEEEAKALRQAQDETKAEAK